MDIYTYIPCIQDINVTEENLRDIKSDWNWLNHDFIQFMYSTLYKSAYLIINCFHYH